jgi:hypothetical protein
MYSVLVWLNNLICGGGRCGVLVRTVSPCAGCLLALRSARARTRYTKFDIAICASKVDDYINQPGQ